MTLFDTGGSPSTSADCEVGALCDVDAVADGLAESGGGSGEVERELPATREPFTSALARFSSYRALLCGCEDEVEASACPFICVLRFSLSRLCEAELAPLPRLCEATPVLEDVSGMIPILSRVSENVTSTV